MSDTALRFQPTTVGNMVVDAKGGYVSYEELAAAQAQRDKARDERNAAEAALKFAAKLLSREDPYFSEMNETEMMAYLIKMPKEMK